MCQLLYGVLALACARHVQAKIVLLGDSGVVVPSRRLEMCLHIWIPQRNHMILQFHGLYRSHVSAGLV